LERRRLARRLDAVALLLQFLLAVTVLVLSGIFLLVVFGFARQVTAELSGWNRWAEVLWRMFRFPDAGLGTWPVLTLLVLALVVMVRCVLGWGRLRRRDRLRLPEPIKGDAVSSS
jgi:hypothetical protein